MRVVAQPTVGSSVELTPTIENNSRTVGSRWSVSADSLPLGSYTLIVLVTDEAGNETVSNPYPVDVMVTIPTSVELQQLGTASWQHLLGVWLLVLSFVSMAWVTLYQYRRYRSEWKNS